jgi:hypothetical protein
MIPGKSFLFNKKIKTTPNNVQLPVKKSLQALTQCVDKMYGQ